MTMDFIIRHWALVVASVLAVAILLFVLQRLYTDSASGQLYKLVADLDAHKRKAKRAGHKVDAAVGKLTQLQARSATTSPRLLSAADEALQDSRMLKKVADDLVLVAQRKVRDLIIEEFPPNRQDGLRNKYL
jgi:hypothetical protein